MKRRDPDPEVRLGHCCGCHDPRELKLIRVRQNVYRCERCVMAGEAIPKSKTVPCDLCGLPTAMTGTRRCDRCWELESRIQAAPELARRILGAIPADGCIYEARRRDGRSDVESWCRTHGWDCPNAGTYPKHQTTGYAIEQPRRGLFRRPVRIRVEPADTPGEWRATAAGLLGRVVAVSPVGRLDQVEEYARNYERYGAWTQS